MISTKKAVNILCLLLSLGLIIVIGYCYSRPLGYGTELRGLICLAGVFGCLAIFLKLKKNRLWLDLFLNSMNVILFSIVAHSTFIMRDYYSWTEAGMPDPTGYRMVILATFLMFSVVFFARSLFVTFKTNSITSKLTPHDTFKWASEIRSPRAKKISNKLK